MVVAVIMKAIPSLALDVEDLRLEAQQLKQLWEMGHSESGNNFLLSL